jgi:hypothetical protein
MLSVTKIVLHGYHFKVTVSDGVNPAYILVPIYDKAVNNLVTDANYLEFWTRVGTGFLVNQYNVIFTNNLIDAKFKDDSLWVAAIDNTAINLYMLNILAAIT